METDREVLTWLHRRLTDVYGESELTDFMHRLRWIIYATPKNKMSRGQKVRQVCNSKKDLLRILPKPTAFEKELLSDL